MDICHDGRDIGTLNILQYIQDTLSLLGCSGHIHESHTHRAVNGRRE
jgi:Icc-related predicted phosphoesterase